ncbi:hypothetical protein EK904_013609 [Melospiza melodia maxima]|nr:hypothetical protein EK904_013609 [Melospiza melodia maxima]
MLFLTIPFLLCCEIMQVLDSLYQGDRVLGPKLPLPHLDGGIPVLLKITHCIHVFPCTDNYSLGNTNCTENRRILMSVRLLKVNNYKGVLDCSSVTSRVKNASEKLWPKSLLKWYNLLPPLSWDSERKEDKFKLGCVPDVCPCDLIFFPWNLMAV